MKRLLPVVLLGLATSPAIPARAYTETPAEDFADRRNLFRVGARTMFDVGLRFRDTGTSIANQAGPATGGGQDRTYADGFVRVDASANDGGQTWFWGYRNDAQYRPGDSALDFHAYSGNPYGDAFDASDDLRWGGEFAYTRIVGPCMGGRWGIDLGFDWTDFRLDDGGSFSGSLTQLTDSYALVGVIPPSAPYSGSSAGPGPLLSDSPTRTFGPLPTTVNGHYSLSGSLYGFKLGPMIEVPLGDHVSAQLSAGLAVALFDADLEFNEVASVASGATWVRDGRGGSRDWLFGGYARAQLTLRLTDALGLYGAAEFQGLEGTAFSAGSREAQLDFDSTFQFAAGLTLRF